MDPYILHFAQKKANLPRDNPDGGGLRANVLGTVEEPVAAPPRSTPSSNLDRPEIHLMSSKVAVEFAFFPFEVPCAYGGGRDQDAVGCMEAHRKPSE